MPKAEKKRAGARGSNGVAGAPSLTVVMVPVGDLNPAPYNPRKMTEKQAADLTASIRKFGMQEPLVVNRAPGRENVVIGGHQRLNVCKLLGHTAVPVVYVELAEPEERELNLRLNKNTGEWDWDLLAEFDVPLLRDVGFTDEELAKNFDLDGGETPTDADVLPEKVEARTKLGDVWVLGGHRLVCGDSVKDDAAVRLALDGALADCVWTDPPYGVSYEGKAGTVANDSLSDEEHEAFITNALPHALTHAREGAAAYVTHASSQTILTWRAFGNAGGRFSQPLVWAKDRIVLGRSDYHFAHEPILYGWKPGASHRWFGGRDKSTVLNVPRPTRSEEHPTMKPVELVRQMVVNSTMPGEVVLDPFGGSGSTLLACEVSRRRAALVELVPRFCDVTVARWERLTGKTAALVRN